MKKVFRWLVWYQPKNTTKYIKEVSASFEGKNACAEDMGDFLVSLGSSHVLHYEVREEAIPAGLKRVEREYHAYA